MNKTFKKLSYVFSCICAFFVCGIVANAASAPEVIDGDVYANGTPITISAKADGSEGAHITWADGSFDVEKKPVSLVVQKMQVLKVAQLP